MHNVTLLACSLCSVQLPQNPEVLWKSVKCVFLELMT
jgi:hypothetical protein